MHRNLVEATFAQPLTCQEQRILYAVISNLPAPEFLKDEKGNFITDEEGNKQIVNFIDEAPLYQMTLKEFGEMIGVKEVSYIEIKKICTDFMKKLIDVRDINATTHDPKDFDYIQWIIRCKYIDNEGKVNIQLSPHLLPFVTNLTSNFVSVSLGTLMSFNSKYSARLYFLMQQWRKVKTKQLDLERLKEILGVPLLRVEKKGDKEIKIFKLDRYTHFRQRALEPAIKEINEFSDMIVSYKEVKKGRKTAFIEFTIADKPKEKRAEPPKNVPEQTVYEKLIRNAGFGNFNNEFYKNAAEALQDIKDIESKHKLVTYQLESLKRYLTLKQNSINSPQGFIIAEIRKATKRYASTGIFDFNELYLSAGLRVEKLPSWFYETEKEPTIKDQEKFEREKAALEEMLRNRKEAK